MDMDILSVQTSQHADTIKSWLDQAFKTLIDQGVSIDWRKTICSNFTTFTCTISGKNDILTTIPVDIYRYYAADALSDYILQEIETTFIPKLIARKYKDLSAAERERISQQTIAELKSADKHLRKNYILYALLDYFDTCTFVNLEGFVRFRLKDFWRRIASTVDKAVTQLKAEKEYREFIRLLKHFVALHEPKIPLAQVIVRAGGHFRLLDINNNVIDNDYLEGMVTTLVDNQVDYEDLLLSALIVTAPATIILHLDAKWPVTQTILNVFEGRVKFCERNCEYCRRSNEYMKRLGLY